jgi:hypothetical protein
MRNVEVLRFGQSKAWLRVDQARKPRMPAGYVRQFGKSERYRSCTDFCDIHTMDMFECHDVARHGPPDEHYGQNTGQYNQFIATSTRLASLQQYHCLLSPW